MQSRFSGAGLAGDCAFPLNSMHLAGEASSPIDANLLSRFGPTLTEVMVECDDEHTRRDSHALQSGWARGVTETRHLATVADAGSNPVGSTLRFYWSGGSVGGEMRGSLPTKVT